MNAVSNKAISDYLSEMGIYHSNQGYKYLMLSIRAILDGDVDRSCVQAIYDHVALKNGITPGQVERAIRHEVRKSEKPVPNKEFLLRAVDELTFAADANAFIFESAQQTSAGQ